MATKNIMLLLLFTFLPFLLFAQTDKKILSPIKRYKEQQRIKKKIALNHLTALQNGVLIVRYETSRNKLNALELMVKQKPKSKRFKRLLRKTTKKAKALQEATITAYTEYYTFSKVIFMPDTLSNKLLAGVRKGIFVNQYLEIDESIELTVDDFYITYSGFTPVSTTSGMEALLIADSENNLLKAPFPYATKLNTLSGTVNAADKAIEIGKIVQNQQRKLDEFRIKRK
ncbi:MAG: hypothetical protein ACPGXZ_17175 [Saprospiraceae bacterium]